MCLSRQPLAPLLQVQVDSAFYPPWDCKMKMSVIKLKLAKLFTFYILLLLLLFIIFLFYFLKV